MFISLKRAKTASRRSSDSNRETKTTSEGGLLIVFFHGRLQPLQKVRKRRRHARPVRDEGRPQRILQELLHRLVDDPGERLDGGALLVAVELEPVQRRVVRVLLDRVLRRAQ